MRIIEGFLKTQGRYKLDYPILLQFLSFHKISRFLYHHKGKWDKKAVNNTFPYTTKDYGSDNNGKLSYFTLGSNKVTNDNRTFIKLATYFVTENGIDTHYTVYSYIKDKDRLEKALQTL